MTHIYIVTPSFNYAQYIDSAIESVVSQDGDFVLHYHVQDGGSTDGTVEKLKKWEALLVDSPLVQCRELHFSWSSEPDQGMYFAINHSFAKLNVPDDAIMGWCNADDIILPHVFSSVAKAFDDVPHMRFLAGTWLFYEYGRLKEQNICMGPYPPEILKNYCCDALMWTSIPQPSVFWKGSLWKKAEGLDTRWKYAADYDLWARFAQYADCVFLPLPLSACSRHTAQLSRNSTQSRYHDVTAYSEERTRICSLEKRKAFMRRFWKNKLLPPYGPVLELCGDQYLLLQKRAWPAMWGNTFRWYLRRRRRYYFRQIEEITAPFTRTIDRIFFPLTNRLAHWRSEAWERLPLFKSVSAIFLRLFFFFRLLPYFQEPLRGKRRISALCRYILSGDFSGCGLRHFDPDYYRKVQFAACGNDILLFQIRYGEKWKYSLARNFSTPYFALRYDIDTFIRENIPLFNHKELSIPCEIDFHGQEMKRTPFAVRDFQHVRGNALSQVEAGNIPLLTSISPTRIKEQKAAIATWLAQGFQPVAVNYPEEIATLKAEFPQVEFEPVRRESKELFKLPRVFLNDAVFYAARYQEKYNAPYAGIINSDVSLYQLLPDVLQSGAEKGLVFSRRVEVHHPNHTTGFCYDRGYDAFFFNPSLLPELPDNDFALGQPFWDLFFPAWCFLRGVNTALTVPLCFHVRHSIGWSRSWYHSLGVHTYNLLAPLLTTRYAHDKTFCRVIETSEALVGGVKKPGFFAMLLNDLLNTLPEMIDPVQRKN